MFMTLVHNSQLYSSPCHVNKSYAGSSSLESQILCCLQAQPNCRRVSCWHKKCKTLKLANDSPSSQRNRTEHELYIAGQIAHSVQDVSKSCTMSQWVGGFQNLNSIYIVQQLTVSKVSGPKSLILVSDIRQVSQLRSLLWQSRRSHSHILAPDCNGHMGAGFAKPKFSRADADMPNLSRGFFVKTCSITTPVSCSQTNCVSPKF